MTRLPSRLLSRLVVDGILPLLDSRVRASESPYRGAPAMVPHPGSRRWPMVHYGIFLPKLPEPYRYLNTMTLLGPTGTEVFDNDYLAAPDVRNTATVLSSTAHADQRFYAAYDAASDCEFATDGSVLRWGEDLTVTVDGSRAHVAARYPEFSADFTMTITDHVSYFVRTPVYDHLSLLAPFEGTLTDASGTTTVYGLGTFEYARSMGLQSLVRRPLPGPLKLPVDFFTYQIIEIDDRTQLLLTCVGARGTVACELLHLRVLGEPARVFDDVAFEILGYGDPLVDERGREMRVPSRFRWTVRENGSEILRLEAAPDSPWRYGHGRGYVGAYSYSGTLFGDDVGGTGYIEWVDTQDEPRRTW